MFTGANSSDNGNAKLLSNLDDARKLNGGTLTLNADGSYSYAVDNANGTVNALNAMNGSVDSHSGGLTNRSTRPITTASRRYSTPPSATARRRGGA